MWVNLTRLFGDAKVMSGSFNSTAGIAAMVINQPGNALVAVFHPNVNVTLTTITVEGERSALDGGSPTKLSHTTLLMYDTLPIPTTTTQHPFLADVFKVRESGGGVRWPFQKKKVCSWCTSVR